MMKDVLDRRFLRKDSLQFFPEDELIFPVSQHYGLETAS